MTASITTSFLSTLPIQGLMIVTDNAAGHAVPTRHSVTKPLHQDGLIFPTKACIESHMESLCLQQYYSSDDDEDFRRRRCNSNSSDNGDEDASFGDSSSCRWEGCPLSKNDKSKALPKRPTRRTSLQRDEKIAMSSPKSSLSPTHRGGGGGGAPRPPRRQWIDSKNDKDNSSNSRVKKVSLPKLVCSKMA